jgi:carboxyvinyl-carboxyphosphonate phosphorylmutase
MTSPALSAHARREKLRAILAGDACVSPASVYDAMSARVAESVGYELGMLGGSVASVSALSAPDLTVATLTEVAGVVRAICRASNLALFIDADHGFGNALSVRRTIEELEHAGAAGMSIEDTLLPMPYGAKADAVIPLDEMVGKLKAAISARQDKALVIVGRTSAIKVEGIEKTIARVRAYEAAGVDALFLAGLETEDELRAVRANVKLPFIGGSTTKGLDREKLRAYGARVLLLGHQPQSIAAEALRQAYAHLFGGGAPGDLAPKMPKPEFMDQVIQGPDYRAWRRDFLAQ